MPDFTDRAKGPLRVISNLQDQACFGCGAGNSQGLQMKFYTDERQIVSWVTVPETMAGWDQIVHGGILATLLDEIMGWSVIALLKKIGVTKTMTVDFLRAVKVGEQLTVVGSIQEIRSARVALVRGTIFDSEKRECARSTGEFSIMEARTAVRLGVVSSTFMKQFEPIMAGNNSV